MKRTTTKKGSVRKARPTAVQKDDPGKPRRHWAGIRSMWPRELPQKDRSELLFHAVPSIVSISEEIGRVTHALQWLQIARGPDHVSIDVTREIVVRALWRASKHLEQRSDYMAELARMTNDTPLGQTGDADD